MLVVGGNFTAPGGATNLIMWTGSSFVNFPGGTDSEVYALHVFGDRLYVGGDFTHVGFGVPAARVASYGPEGWAEVSGGADDWVFALSDFGGEIHAGGWFSTVRNGLVPSPRMARWSPTGAPWITANPGYQIVAAGGTAQFTSQSIVREGTGYTVTGNLTLHGVTKSITFPASIMVTPEGVTAQSEFVLKRFDWNIEYKGKADDLIRDEVVVTLNIAAKRTDSTL